MKLGIYNRKEKGFWSVYETSQTDYFMNAVIKAELYHRYEDNSLENITADLYEDPFKYFDEKGFDVIKLNDELYHLIVFGLANRYIESRFISAEDTFKMLERVTNGAIECYENLDERKVSSNVGKN